MSADRNYGKTKSGQHITEELIDKCVEEPERGYEPGQLSGRHRGPGQPLGGAAKNVVSVRPNRHFAKTQHGERDPKVSASPS